MSEWDEDSEGLFRELEHIQKAVTPQRSLSLPTMLKGWSRHVQRFVGGVHSIPIRESVIWGADDYVAALTIRSMIEDIREEVPRTIVSSVLYTPGWTGSTPSIEISRSRTIVVSCPNGPMRRPPTSGGGIVYRHLVRFSTIYCRLINYGPFPVFWGTRSSGSPGKPI